MQADGRISVPYVLLYYLPENSNPSMRMSYAAAKELMRSTAEVGRIIEIDSGEDLEDIEKKLSGEDDWVVVDNGKCKVYIEILIQMASDLFLLFEPDGGVVFWNLIEQLPLLKKDAECVGGIADRNRSDLLRLTCYEDETRLTSMMKQLPWRHESYADCAILMCMIKLVENTATINICFPVSDWLRRNQRPFHQPRQVFWKRLHLEFWPDNDISILRIEILESERHRYWLLTSVGNASCMLLCIMRETWC